MKNLKYVLLIAILLITLSCSHYKQDIQDAPFTKTAETNGSNIYRRFSSEQKKLVIENLKNTRFEGFYFGDNKIWNIDAGRFYTDTKGILVIYLNISHNHRGLDKRLFVCEVVFNDDKGTVELKVKNKGIGTLKFDNQDFTMPNEVSIDADNKDTRVCLFLQLFRVR